MALVRLGGALGDISHLLHSANDKEDQSIRHVIPDDAIAESQSEYWSPDPETGVFLPPGEADQGGPSDDLSGAAERLNSSPTSPSGHSSVLNQKAWFRTSDDVDVDSNANHTTAKDPSP